MNIRTKEDLLARLSFARNSHVSKEERTVAYDDIAQYLIKQQDKEFPLTDFVVEPEILQRLILQNGGRVPSIPEDTNKTVFVGPIRR